MFKLEVAPDDPADSSIDVGSQVLPTISKAAAGNITLSDASCACAESPSCQKSTVELGRS